jgi:hypothetical protein
VLEGILGLRNIGVPVHFSIRVLSSLADVVAALVVYEMVQRRRGHRQGVAAGIVVAASPVLFMISSFHGNTDPIFSMLILLSLYLLVEKDRPLWAGAVIALAVGVKIVAIVAIPVLLVYALTRGWRSLLRFVSAAAAVLVVTWGPALAFQWDHVRVHVLDYAGLGLGQWGFIQIGHWVGNPGWVAWAEGHGRFWIVLACAIVPALGVWRRPQTVVIGTALTLTAFMALTPAFAVQYLAWAAAASCLISIWGGLAYNLFAGALLLHVYDRWSGDRFFATFSTVAHYRPLTPNEVILGMFPWGVLILTVVGGLWQIGAAPRRRAAHPDNSVTPGRPTGGDSELIAARGREATRGAHRYLAGETAGKGAPSD